MKLKKMEINLARLGNHSITVYNVACLFIHTKIMPDAFSAPFFRCHVIHKCGNTLIGALFNAITIRTQVSKFYYYCVICLGGINPLRDKTERKINGTMAHSL